MSDGMIQINSLNYIYGIGSGYEKIALRDINLKIKEGEFLAIVGHTGSGKSTLMQQMIGLDKPTSGQVFYDGADIHDKKYDRKKLRSQVGMVFQYAEHQLFETSVIRDVMFGPKNQGISDAKAEQYAYDALRMVGIEDEEMDVSPFILSGGQKRRVAIAGVLAMQPKVLLLDEPTAGLDPVGRRAIFRLLQELHEARNMTIVFTSHSMEDVAVYANRMIVMNRGGILLDGTPTQIFAYREQLAGIGLGVPVVTEVLQKLKERGAAIDSTPVTLMAAADAVEAWYKRGKGGV